MYNDEHNLYHYTYRRDGTETGQRYDARNPEPELRPAQVMQEAKPVRKKRTTGLKVAALALSCAILGGAAGGGAVWAATRSQSEGSTVNVSSRPATQVAIHSVDGKTVLTDAEVYAANVNSVVSINTTASGGTNLFGQKVETASAGSGFILSKDGYIVTNYHVIKNAEAAKVTLYNGDTYDAVYVGGEEDYDIAVIKVEATDLQPVTLGDSSTLNVGDHVLAIGNPLGELTFSQTGGMVSCVDRAINVDGTPFNMIQTDASINPGNSGGPLFNQYGEVIGIVSAKYTQSASGTNAEGLGFAIPINDVFSMIKDIMTNGYVTNKPFLGITPQTMTESMAAQFRYDVTSGVFVCSVEEGSAAAKAELRMGDVITEVDGTEIKTVEDLNLAKKKYSAGDTATLTVYREGETREVEITWGSVPEEQQTAQQDNSFFGNGNGGNDSSQNGGTYSIPPNDFFEYFFGSRGR